MNCDDKKCVEATKEATNLVIYQFKKQEQSFSKITNLSYYYSDSFFVNCSSGSCSVVKTLGYYIDLETSNLYKVSNDGEASIITSKGYFLNSGDSSKIIQCNGTCSEIAISSITASTCTKAGDIIQKSGKVSICITSSESKEIKKQSSPIYETMALESGSGFLGISDKKKVTIKFDSNGESAVLMEEATLRACKSSVPTSDAVCFDNAGNNEICISSDKKLYKSGTDPTTTCAQHEGTADNSLEISYYDVEGKKSDDPTDGGEYVVYQCKTDADRKLGNCEVVKGYTKIGSKIVQCNGWKGESCTVVASASGTCSKDDNGKMGANGLCFSTTNVLELPSSYISTVAFELSKTSGIYGLNKEDIAILKVTGNSAVVTALEGGNV